MENAGQAETRAGTEKVRGRGQQASRTRRQRWEGPGGRQADLHVPSHDSALLSDSWSGSPGLPCQGKAVQPSAASLR